jgi:putative transposase
MAFLENQIYHIYNRSIHKELLFKSDADYTKFLEMTRKHLADSCEILGWCLMPNHFHFLLYTNLKSIEKKKVGGLELQSLQNGIRNLLSSYSKSYNFHNKRKGNLFQQKTKYKEVLSDPLQALHYIHQNPWKAKLVMKMEDWVYSSFKDFTQQRNGTLCNLKLAEVLLGIQQQGFYQESYQSVSAETILKLGLD